jgi:hypothetical protein
VIVAAMSLVAGCRQTPPAQSTPPPAPAKADAPAPPPQATPAAPMDMPMDMPMTAGSSAAATGPLPTVTLEPPVERNGVWSFDVETNLTPTRAMEPRTPMYGHIHVYVDGVERMMIYEKHFTLSQLTPGPHEVTVELAGTDHKTLYRDRKPIASRVRITVPPAAGKAGGSGD